MVRKAIAKILAEQELRTGDLVDNGNGTRAKVVGLNPLVLESNGKPCPTKEGDRWSKVQQSPTSRIVQSVVDKARAEYAKVSETV